MKFYFTIAWPIFACTLAQAKPFVNMDFEAANTNKIIIERKNPYVSGFGNMADLLPGWALEFPRGSPMPQIGFNLSLPEHSYSEPPNPSIFSREALQPSYTNYLTGDYELSIQTSYQPLVLSQIGDIPAFASELNVFFGRVTSAGCPLCVNMLRLTLDGVEVATDNVLINGTPALRGDISGFAGIPNVKLEMEMRLQRVPDQFNEGLAYLAIDRIEFVVPTPIPTTPRISQAAITNGTSGFSFYWSANVASKYQVESATNIPAAWQPIGSPITSTNGTFYFTDTSATNQISGQRFYRLRALP